MANFNKLDLNELVSENQTIKIVPSIEDSLRTIGLNVDLDENAKFWFEQLKASWKTWKKSAAIGNQIELYLSSVPDPHRVALLFTIKSNDFKDCKPKTLPYFIIETLQKWSLANGVSPEDSLKLPAFHIAIQQRNQNFLCLMMKTYQVSSVKETVLPIIKSMIRDDNCRQASQIVIAMGLYEDIPVEELMFPLVLQDKCNVIDEYLSESPSQVKPLLQFLDKLLDKNFNIHEYIQNYIAESKIGHIKYEKLHYKPLGKLVGRLCNKYNVPIETCKNLSKNRTTGGLRYLVYQKYQEHNVSTSVWDDLVKDSLRQCAESAYEFIDLLVEYDRKEALKWAEYLNITKNQLPLALRDMSLQESNDKTEENWDTTASPAPEQVLQTYYKLSVPDDHVTFIDSAEKFYDLMVSNLIKCNVVSIDCEWKPSFGATQSQVALIQIATTCHIYLIDTLALNRPEFSSFWHSFHKSFLENNEVVKIGFGLEQDLKEMKTSISGLSNIKVKGEGLLDLGLLWKNLVDCGLTLPSHSDTGGNSLNTLVQSCFGLPLDKTEQCSNWELRPLRSTQIYYAALDAYVLVEIYYYLQKLSHQQDIDFEEICNNVMIEGKKKCQKKIKNLEKIQSSDNQSISSKDVKFLIEPSLSDLLSYLRYCGIDTTLTTTKMLWYDVINLAISEDRLVLTGKLKCTPNASFPQTSILDVGKGSVQDKLLLIFNSFNISVKSSDILSRCINCNNKDLIKLTTNEVNRLCIDYQAAKNVAMNYQRDSDDEDVDYRNFLSDSDCDEDYLHPVTNITSNKTCRTGKGAVIEISDANKLAESQKPAILCEDCGKLLWDEDPLLQPIVKIVSSVTNINIE